MDMKIAVQQMLALEHQSKIDMYYKKDYGTLYVLDGQALIPENVIHALPDF